MLVILCTLWQSTEGKVADNFTGIFTQLRDDLIGRTKLRLRNRNIRLEPAVLQDAMRLLTTLAYNGLREDTIVFGEEEVLRLAGTAGSQQARDLAMDLGFINKDETRDAATGRVRMVFNFAHLTVQEFLAATHMVEAGLLFDSAAGGASTANTSSTKSPIQRRRLFSKIVPGSRGGSHAKLAAALVQELAARPQLHVALQFACGLLGAGAVHTIVQVVAQAKKKSGKPALVLALQCCFEAKVSNTVALLKPLMKGGGKVLNLQRCGLSGDELAPLFPAVSALKLTAIDLSNNNFDVEAARAMEQGLRRCGRLKELRIAGNPLEFQVLAKFFLQGDPVNIVSSKQVQHMQSVIPQVGSPELNLKNTNVPLQTFKAIARCLQCWTSIHLSGILMEDDGVAALGQALTANTTLTSLTWEKSEIGHASAFGQALATNTTLTSLDLSDNHIGADGAAALGQALAANTALTSLHLHYNKIGHAGAAALAQALAVNTTLTSLHLKWNNIGDTGAAALGQALATNTTLTSLDLRHNDIRDDGAAALDTNTTLNLLH
eukprot:m.448271 g.448271  ORF g.448271 m.448271 type:complete len:548 (-) comp20315_c14_seq30:319-1962(-)